jgi:hypothetical protein
VVLLALTGRLTFGVHALASIELVHGRGFTVEDRRFLVSIRSMLTNILVLAFLLVVACATVNFEHSLKEKGRLPKKISVFVKDIWDAFLGLG